MPKIGIKSVDTIVSNDLCISCGSCFYACPNKNIVMSYSVIRGKWQAVIKSKNVCAQCCVKENCLSVCPSFDKDYTLFLSGDNELMGRIDKFFTGWAKDLNLRSSSSSGGFITQLSVELLKRKRIDGVISLKRVSGLDYFPVLFRNTPSFPNSVYHNVNFQNAFDIIRSNSGRFLLIGLPCQLTGIAMLLNLRRFQHLKSRIFAKVALICGYSFDRVNSEMYSFFLNFKFEEIRYRIGGRYRKHCLKNSIETRVIDPKAPSSLSDFVNNSIFWDPYLVQKACLFCVDHLGYASDLSVGDAWLKKFQNDQIGSNIIISRNSCSTNLIQSLEGFHLQEGIKEDLIESQGVYAKPIFWLENAFNNVVFSNFVPKHKVSDSALHLERKVRLMFFFKSFIIKRLIFKRKFFLARFLFYLIEFRRVLKFVWKKFKRRFFI